MNSDLRGVAVDLPEPLYKKTGSQLPLTLKYLVKPENSDLTLSLEGLGKAQIAFKSDSSVDHASVLMGPQVKFDSEIPAEKASRVNITGFLPQLGPGSLV